MFRVHADWYGLYARASMNKICFHIGRGVFKVFSVLASGTMSTTSFARWELFTVSYIKRLRKPFFLRDLVASFSLVLLPHHAEKVWISQRRGGSAKWKRSRFHLAPLSHRLGLARIKGKLNLPYVLFSYSFYLARLVQYHPIFRYTRVRDSGLFGTCPFRYEELLTRRFMAAVEE